MIEAYSKAILGLKYQTLLITEFRALRMIDIFNIYIYGYQKAPTFDQSVYR
jgi:hypothetical protein